MISSVMFVTCIILTINFFNAVGEQQFREEREERLREVNVIKFFSLALESLLFPRLMGF